MSGVAADGQPVLPVGIDESLSGVAETLDVVVRPMEDQPSAVFAQAMDRSGYARATLAPRIGLEAPVPALDPRAILTMADMGHGDHAGHDMSKSEEHTSELQSLMRISYAVFCLKKKKITTNNKPYYNTQLQTIKNL